jgi:hypothetical protein
MIVWQPTHRAESVQPALWAPLAYTLRCLVPAAIGLAAPRRWAKSAAYWAQAAFKARGAESLRSIMALCGLIKRHSPSAMNTACSKTLKSGTHRSKKSTPKKRCKRDLDEKK